MKPFDIRDPLPTGTTILEASAGTGKTYTVGALVTRYVAEGVATLEQLLVVTFGRVASLELRERVRGQLVAAERGLADPAAARAGDDHLLALLAEPDDDEVSRRRRRLATALADFDAATIATTHQFCQQVLTGLGVAGDSEPGATLVESLDDLVVEVVDDLYVRGFAPSNRTAIFTRAQGLELGRAAIGNPQARLEPAEAEPGTTPARRRAFADAVRVEVDRRKRRHGLLGYDDLLSRVASALGPDDAAARARMRARWKVVLVDEFQDTDPVQWQVLERAFAGHATVVLIGDPKQAIYAFRGGDVTTYLAAARTAQTSATLAQNWRSDTPLVEALHATIGDAELGDPKIVVRQVSAFHGAGRLVGAPSDAPLRLRVVTRYQLGVAAGSKIPVAQARAYVADDLAADIARLLASGARFEDRALVAGDVAVLTGTHAQATLARNALAIRGVPAVIAGSGSVYATPAAENWLVLLEALEQPHRSGRVRAAALTPFLGRTATDLALGGEVLTDELGAMFRLWADLLASRGVAALLEVATTDQGLLPRLLAQTGGERELTDLRHVGQGLHAAAVEEGLGLAALVEWLRRRRAEAEGDGTAERTRRLDSDAAAVQVVTLHASKGLEYPVVYLPFAFDRWVPTPNVLLLHDEDGNRVLDVGGPGSPGRRDRERQAAGELAGEALRLLYVGLTRAQSQVIMWWAPSTNTPDSGLHRLLFGRSAGSSAVPDSTPLVSDKEAATRLADLAARGGPVVEAAVPHAPVGPAPTVADAPTLSVGVFDRALDTAWRRMSYSSLSAVDDGHAQPGVASEPENGEREDEAVPAVVAPVDGDQDLFAVPSPMADLPRGTAFGTLVHAILEHTDPQAEDLEAELLLRSREQLARRPVAPSAVGLAAALRPVLSTPLGPLAGGLSLQDIPVRDRLTELDFELPLAGGDHPATEALLGDLAPLLRKHLAGDDPLRSYADRLGTPELGCAGIAWLPDREPGRGAQVARPALPRRRLQDELARRDRRSAAHRLGLPAGGLDRGDGQVALPPAGVALQRRAAPLPALAAARVRPGTAPRRSALPLRPRHVRREHASCRRPSVRRVLVAPAASSRGGDVGLAGRGRCEITRPSGWVTGAGARREGHTARR